MIVMKVRADLKVLCGPCGRVSRYKDHGGLMRQRGSLWIVTQHVQGVKSIEILRGHKAQGRSSKVVRGRENP